jgi:gas vesicle protein
MYREMDDYPDSSNGLMLFLLGAAIGAGLALLFAPEQGSRTRERLKGMASDAADQTRRSVNSAVERTKGMVEQGREYIQGKKEQLTDAYESGRETIGRTAGGGNASFTRTTP